MFKNVIDALRNINVYRLAIDFVFGGVTCRLCLNRGGRNSNNRSHRIRCSWSEYRLWLILTSLHLLCLAFLFHLQMNLSPRSLNILGSEVSALAKIRCLELAVAHHDDVIHDFSVAVTLNFEVKIAVCKNASIDISVEESHLFERIHTCFTNMLFMLFMNVFR